MCPVSPGSLTFLENSEEIFDRLAFDVEQILDVEAFVTRPAHGQVGPLVRVQQVNHLQQCHIVRPITVDPHVRNDLYV